MRLLLILVLLPFLAIGIWMVAARHKRRRRAYAKAEQIVKQEIADYAARSRAADNVVETDRAQSVTFGRKRGPGAFTNELSAILTNPIEKYDGIIDLFPWGYDLLNAQSRVVPEAYWGKWVKTSRLANLGDSPPPDAEIFRVSAKQLQDGADIQPVVLVYTGEENAYEESELPEIAVVSEHVDEDGKWAFSLLLLSLRDNGQTLMNDESMDSPWTRIKDSQTHAPNQ